METSHQNIADLEVPLFGTNEIHLWRVKLNPSDEILHVCQNSLSEFELRRVEFYDFEKVKQNYLVSQGMLRHLVGKYSGRDGRDVKLGRHRKGKPFSADDPGLFFNMSNSGDYVVYAFSREGEVGIDLEDVRNLDDLEELILKNLTINERGLLDKDPDERLKNFFRFWTFKESYLKAIGEGMRIEPHRLEFTIERDRVKYVGMNGFDDPEDWLFDELPFDNYIRTLTHMVDKPVLKDFEIV